MKSQLLLLFVIALCYSLKFSSRQFSIEILNFTRKETNGHVCISPFGIWSLMTGIALGAGGKSKAQLNRALALPNDDDSIIKGYQNLAKAIDPGTDSVTFKCRNFMFVDPEFNIVPGFQKIMTSDLGGVIKILNFKDQNSAAKIANDYIKESGASASDVLKPDDFEQSGILFTNVMQFKGLWASPFNESNTAIEEFYDENKNKIGRVNMMYQRAQLPFSYMQSLKSLILELPYASDNKYSMIIILPQPKVKVNDVYKQFETVSFDEIIDRLESDMNEYGLEDVDVKLPRFQQTSNLVMTKPLNDMGVFDIFNPDVANLNRLARDNNKFVSSIIHKAHIEVTESGTVATAESSAYFSNRQPLPIFEANRPFIYFVIEKRTTTILFEGIYSQSEMF